MTGYLTILSIKNKLANNLDYKNIRKIFAKVEARNNNC